MMFEGQFFTSSEELDTVSAEKFFAAKFRPDPSKPFLQIHCAMAVANFESLTQQGRIPSKTVKTIIHNKDTS